MEHVKGAIQALLENLKKKRPPSDADPELILKRVFAPEQLEHLEFKGISREILYLKADSSTWLYYFNLQKKDLLDKLCSQIPTLKDVRFSLGLMDKKGIKSKR